MSASITQKIREKKRLERQARSNNIKEPETQNLESKTVEDTLSSIDECDTYDFKHTMFISDKKINKEVRSKLDDFPKIKEWSDQFINRDCRNLAEKGVTSCY